MRPGETLEFCLWLACSKLKEMKFPWKKSLLQNIIEALLTQGDPVLNTKKELLYSLNAKRKRPTPNCNL